MANPNWVKGQVAWNKGLKNTGKFQYWLGKHRSEETKQKIREKRKFQVISEKTKQKMSLAAKGKNTWMKGRKLTEEWRKHIAEKSHYQKGSKHKNWLGGKSFEPYGIEFNNELREKIRTKFGRTCVECGYTEQELGYRLIVHHLDYNKQNNSEDNLIPLCRSCHFQTNYTRSDWEDYFKNKLKNNAFYFKNTNACRLRRLSGKDDEEESRNVGERNFEFEEITRESGYNRN